MLIIHYNKSVDADGRPVFEPLNGTMLVLGRQKEGWNLPPKEVKLEELTEPWRGVYLALASGLASAGEAWVAERVTAVLSFHQTETDEGVESYPCVELTVNAVHDETQATRAFTHRDKPEFLVTAPQVLELYNWLHS